MPTGLPLSRTGDSHTLTCQGQIQGQGGMGQHSHFQGQEESGQPMPQVGKATLPAEDLQQQQTPMKEQLQLLQKQFENQLHEVQVQVQQVLQVQMQVQQVLQVQMQVQQVLQEQAQVQQAQMGLTHTVTEVQMPANLGASHQHFQNMEHNRIPNNFQSSCCCDCCRAHQMTVRGLQMGPPAAARGGSAGFVHDRQLMQMGLNVDEDLYVNSCEVCCTEDSRR